MVSAHHSFSLRLAGRLGGAVAVPAAALEAHLALILAALSVGRSTVTGIGERGDIQVTIAALRAFGCRIEAIAENGWQIDGVGVGGLREPEHVLSVEGAGLGVPLLITLAATQPMTTIFAGGDGLERRSWLWLTTALEGSGAGFLGRPGAVLPMTVLGASNPLPAAFRARSREERASFLLAALSFPGAGAVAHDFPEDDPVDAIFSAFGARLSREDVAGGGITTNILGQTELWPGRLDLFGDVATALMIATAVLIRRDGEVALTGLVFGERLIGALEGFTAMGADLSLEGWTIKNDLPVADLRVRAGALLAPEEAADAIDDYPMVAVLAAHATGRTVLRDWDRRPGWLEPFAQGLRACGVDARAEGSSLVIIGNGGGPVPGGCRIEGPLDHRLAAAFLILGLATEAPVILDQGDEILPYFPGLLALLTKLGGEPITISS